jgi:GNAT superfamily N-acetyltransferase
MTELPRVGQLGALAGAAELRPIQIDELSTVRYIHAASLRLHAAQVLSEEEVEAFTQHVYAASYSDNLLRQSLLGAYIDRELVGTAGWTVADDVGSSVRLRSIFVRPLFTGMGLGTRLVHAIEASARAAGFVSYSIRATVNATGFFEHLGYTVTSHGVRPLFGQKTLPVVFMRKTDHHAAWPAQQPSG